MIRLILRRIAVSIPLVLSVTFLTFVLNSLSPGDMVATLLQGQATNEQYDALRHQLGLDRPILVQYGDWLDHAIHGDLGKSFFTGESVVSLLDERFWVSLSIILGALLVCVTIGISLGAISAVRGGAIGRTVDLLSMAGLMFPSFWVALVLISVFAVSLHWLPAVGYANSVLGARTVKHPDFLDLCIALTGRAPQAGVYLEQNRAPRRIIEVRPPADTDDAFWPMLGWLVGQAAPDRVPLIRGLEAARPGVDDLKALCAAFGTTSAAPMLHVAGVTPEADSYEPHDADTVRLGASHFIGLWQEFNAGRGKVDLVALGSPHFSFDECRRFAGLMAGRHVHPDVTVIATVGRATLAAIREAGLETQLRAAGVSIVPDLCWCSISEPVFPPQARTLITNSGKYAHYAPGLCGREVRFGNLCDCAHAAETGTAPEQMPGWLQNWLEAER